MAPFGGSVRLFQGQGALRGWFSFNIRYSIPAFHGAQVANKTAIYGFGLGQEPLGEVATRHTILAFAERAEYFSPPSAGERERSRAALFVRDDRTSRCPRMLRTEYRST